MECAIANATERDVDSDKMEMMQDVLRKGYRRNMHHLFLCDGI